MANSDKPRRRRHGSPRDRSLVVLKESRPARREEPNRPVVRSLQRRGVALRLVTLATTRLPLARRYAVRFGAFGALALLAAPIVAWLHYQSVHVTSMNAAVRGHIAELGTPLTGLVASVEVDAGDRVAAGQVLVRLDDRTFRAEVNEAAAELEGLQRKIDVERAAIAHELLQVEQEEQGALANVAAARAQNSAAESQAQNARRLHEARQSLAASGVISNQDLLNAETGSRTAQALVQEARAKQLAALSAEESARLTRDGLAIRERGIGVLEAEVQRARARLAKAEADLDSASVRAPEAGGILRRIIQPGASVEVGQPLMSMWLGREVWVDAWIDEDDISSVRVGDPATVSLRSLPDRELAGVVDKIGLATDLEMPSEVPQQRTQRMSATPVVGIRVRLLDPPDDLVPGLSAVVAIRRAAN
ncbi:MAG TPA: HlyD family efflux transporter periplasmic adaptor subunit [Gammaproteobacteria bacterium]|nr:HlyD family efflux transporter periplasmic adaptor subunit [Gammaproteobacteria bacterium]